MKEKTVTEDASEEEAPVRAPLLGKLGAFLAFLTGVVLPVACVGTELASGMCSDIYLDPLPDALHLVAVAGVPLVSAALLAALLLQKERWVTPLSHASAVALGVSALYAVAFVPLLPLSLIAVAIYGLGFLGLGPLLSSVTLLVLRRKLWHLGPTRFRTVWPGLAAGAAVLLLSAAPEALTMVAATRALSADPATSRAGVRMLRSYGDEETLWRLGAGWGPAALGPAAFLVGVGNHFTVAWDDPGRFDPREARGLYFAATGRMWEDDPAREARSDRAFRRRTWRRAWSRWDPYVGTRSVGTVLQDLSLERSALQGSVDPDAALAYLEWDLTFENHARWQQREARARIQLPPGGVVSRLTLWVNGEPREAAWAGKGEVTEAYTNIVSQSRDPALVTRAGGDRVLLQCFPVPAGGSMRVRLGVTVPLRLLDPRSSRLVLPALLSRNFRLAPSLETPVTVASRGPLEVRGSTFETVEVASWLRDPEAKAARAVTERFLEGLTDHEGAHVARGSLPVDQHASLEVVARTTGAPFGVSWALDPRGEDRNGVAQAPGPRRHPDVDEVVLVLDGSATMAPHLDAVADAVAGLPTETRIRLLLAHDALDPADEERTPADRIRALEPLGGQDNRRALARALEHAAGKGRVAVVWIHGPQPFGPPEEEGTPLLPGDPAFRLYDVSLGRGNVRTLQDWEADRRVLGVATQGGVGPALRRLFEDLSGAERTVMVRRRVPAGELAVTPGAHRTSFHLVRLWARDEILRQVAVGGTAEAARLGHVYQLVSPASGAVVLESAEQYEEAGLTPASAEQVPSIPEPETWALLLLVLAACTLEVHRRGGLAPTRGRAS